MDQETKRQRNTEACRRYRATANGRARILEANRRCRALRRTCIERAILTPEEKRARSQANTRRYYAKHPGRRREIDQRHWAAVRASQARPRITKPGLEMDRKSAREQYAANPQKFRAHAAVYQALKGNRIQRPAKCSDCGRNCKPQAHHHAGYASEKWLTVTWLCSSCHKNTHLAD